jgi:hypothetical protein
MNLRLYAGTAILLLFTAMPARADQDAILPRSTGGGSSEAEDTDSFKWQPALKQSFSFLAIQQSFRIATQPSTRSQLRGPYFGDWVTSVRNISGWHDGDSVLANYVAHPMEGAIAGYIQVQNDPRYRKVQFGENGYWRSRLKAFAWSAAFSTNYELGPIGDAAIGNVGKQPGTKGVVDLVVTPTVGMGWMVTEDVLDRHLILPLERRIHNPTVRLLVRSWLNPSRSMSNALRGRWPWHRDSRNGVSD